MITMHFERILPISLRFLASFRKPDLYGQCKNERRINSIAMIPNNIVLAGLFPRGWTLWITWHHMWCYLHWLSSHTRPLVRAHSTLEYNWYGHIHTTYLAWHVKSVQRKTKVEKKLHKDTLSWTEIIFLFFLLWIYGHIILTVWNHPVGQHAQTTEEKMTATSFFRHAILPLIITVISVTWLDIWWLDIWWHLLVPPVFTMFL